MKEREGVKTTKIGRSERIIRKKDGSEFLVETRVTQLCGVLQR